MNEPSDTWWVSEQVVAQWSYLFPSVIPRSARYAMILGQSLKRTYFVSGSFIQNWAKKKRWKPCKISPYHFFNIPFSSQKQTRKRTFNSVILRVHSTCATAQPSPHSHSLLWETRRTKPLHTENIALRQRMYVITKECLYEFQTSFSWGILFNHLFQHTK